MASVAHVFSGNLGNIQMFFGANQTTVFKIIKYEVNK